MNKHIRPQKLMLTRGLKLAKRVEEEAASERI